MILNIFHTNDIHADYENLGKIYTYLKNNRKDNDFYFDSGDFLDLKDIIVQADKGVSASELLNILKPEAMTIGNNEIDSGFDNLVKIVSKTNMICCNITDNNNNKIPGIKDYQIIERLNKRFLIIGIAPFYSREMKDNNFNGFFCLYGLKVHPSIKIIQKIIDDHKGEYDFCIVLAHNGLTPETTIMKEVKGIDLMLGGHSHSIEAFDNYNQCGVFGQYVGKVSLDVSDKGIKIISNENIEVSSKQSVEFVELLDKKRNYAQEVLSIDLIANEDLLFDAYKECLLINFVCDSLYDYFGGDFALMHNGIAEFSLLKPVSRKSLIECFPSKLNPTIYKLKGSKILEAIKLSFDGKHIHEDGKGAGFRGHTLGTLSYSSNVKIVKEPLQVFVDDKPLDLDKEYTIITDDYLQRGTGYPSLKVEDKDATWHIWFIRDMMYHYINNQKIYDSAKIKRIVL